MPRLLSLILILVVMSHVPAIASEFTRSSAYASVEAFVAAAKSFRPAATASDLSSLFTVLDDDLKTGTPVTPVSAITTKAADALWSDSSHALVFVTARPPTDATQSEVGVLFLLVHSRPGWHIADMQRFAATGKYAGVSAKLTADAGTGYQLGSDGMMPVVTVTECHGGRGYEYFISASYTFRAGKLTRMNPK